MTGTLDLDGRWLLDAHGRHLVLRGVNLGGDSKVPYPDGGTQHPGDFADHRIVSFVGRPFPIEEAAEHLGRLRRWGFRLLRLLVTWEAVEHAGPGLHDEAYLDFLAEVCRLAGEHGFLVVIDFHQDVFSRMTGGDGAPGWVLEAAGLDLARIGPSGSALVMQERYDYDDPRREQPDRYPRMCWSENYLYPANGILWTLFFAGALFAPGFRVDGRNIQDFLQDHYLGAQRAVAGRLRGLPGVVGFGTLNEPSRGWIGCGMGDRRTEDRPGRPARPGLAFSPIDALAAASGIPVRVPELRPNWIRGRCAPVRNVLVNEDGIRLWRDGCEDPFLAGGAWRRDGDRAEVLRDDHFRAAFGRAIEFDRDCLLPFFGRVAANVRAVRPDWLIFAEKDAYDAIVEPALPGPLPDRTVAAPHWYDVAKLLLKRGTAVTLDPVTRWLALGRGAVRTSYVRQIGRIVEASADRPTLLCEFGIPMDMHRGRAYRSWARGDRTERPWQAQIRSLELMYDALDELQIGSTQWNYTAGNRNDGRVGDGWNQEDLSIFSRDQQGGPGDGGRALPAFVRPYAPAVAGLPLPVVFDRRSGRFELRWEADPAVCAPTEVFVPDVQYPEGFDARVEPDADVERDVEAQVLRIRTRQAGAHRLLVTRLAAGARTGGWHVG